MTVTRAYSEHRHDYVEGAMSEPPLPPRRRSGIEPAYTIGARPSRRAAPSRRPAQAIWAMIAVAGVAVAVVVAVVLSTRSTGAPSTPQTGAPVATTRSGAVLPAA